MSDIDLQLYKKVRNDDLNAFDILFAKYYPILCRFACLILKDQNSAEEVVQEFFIYFWENRKQLLVNEALKSYFYASVRNRSINFIRNQKTRKNYENTYS